MQGFANKHLQLHTTIFRMASQMNCPICKGTKLQRSEYEGAKVHHCPDCKGYLVKRQRLSAIRNSLERSDEEFMEELAATAAVDSKQKLQCPSCTRAMTKQRRKVGPQTYYVDQCSSCSETWFDGGELAKMQLQYEGSEKGAEMFRFQKRLATMTDEERAELDARIARLGKAKILDRSDYILFAWLLS